jgi:hypothetical protein
VKGDRVEAKDQGLTEDGRARRRFLKQAVTVTWASPLIVTMMSRAAHAQGEVCGTYTVEFDPVTQVPRFGCATTQPCGSTFVCGFDLDNPPGVGGNCFCVAR